MKNKTISSFILTLFERMRRFFLGALASISLWSCNNDLEIYSDPVDLPYVYGVVTSNKKEHYVKVTKTFQKLAKDVTFDDLYYKDDSINVYIDEYIGSALNNTFEGLPVIASDKDSGEFIFPDHKYYKFTNSLLQGASAATNVIRNYTIRVELNSATTVIKNFDNFRMNNPIKIESPTQGSLNQKNAEIKFVNLANVLVPEVITWEQIGGGNETATLKLHIKETNITSGEIDTVVVPIQFYNDLPTADKVSASLELSHFYKQIPNQLKNDPEITREILNVVHDNSKIKGYGVELDIWSASKDFTTYETILFDQSGISQDKPNFTNLENALGIFTSRSNRKVSAASNSIFLGQDVLDSLSCSGFFFDYNFARYQISNTGEIEKDLKSTRCNY